MTQASQRTRAASLVTLLAAPGTRWQSERARAARMISSLRKGVLRAAHRDQWVQSQGETGVNVAASAYLWVLAAPVRPPGNGRCSPKTRCHCSFRHPAGMPPRPLPPFPEQVAQWGHHTPRRSTASAVLRLRTASPASLGNRFSSAAASRPSKPTPSK